MATFNGNLLANRIDRSADTQNNLINGLGGNDTLLGGGGDDTLDGGTGNDLMLGGRGNDTYIVNATGDKITEAADGGIDTVLSSISLDLSKVSAFVEHLTLTGTSGLSGTGNGLDNTLTGNAGANTLSGLDGNDLLRGLAGKDRLLGGTGNDTLDGGTGNDTLEGGLGDDTYIVDSTGDLITEGANAGTDEIVTQLSWTLSGNSAQVEHLTLTGTAAVNATGNAVGNRLTGNTAANRLDGQAGDDMVRGGAGNDTLMASAGNDTLAGGDGADTYVFNMGDGHDVIEADGSDTITLGAGLTLEQVSIGQLGATAPGAIVLGLGASDSITLTQAGQWDGLTLRFADGRTLGGAQIMVAATGPRPLILEGTSGNDILNGEGLNDTLRGLDGIDTLLGGAGNDLLEGGNGSDSLDGGTGADTMMGGAGSDIYVIDNAGDVVIEQAHVGSERPGPWAPFFPSTDIALTSISLDATPDHVELIQMTGNEDLELTGNDGAQALVGNTGHNRLAGRDGDDTLTGDVGNDTLRGDAGADTYTFYQGHGHDVIEADGSDTIVLGAGLTLEQVSIGRLGATAPGAIVLGLGASDSITLTQAGQWDGLTLRFADGRTLSGAQIVQQATQRNLITTSQSIDLSGSVERVDDVVVIDQVNTSIEGRVYTTYPDGYGGQPYNIPYTVTTLTYAQIDVVGNARDNVITGGDARAVFDPNQSTMPPWADRTVYAGSTGNRLDGGAGNDTVRGMAGDDTLLGGTGHDVLEGGGDHDWLDGGQGDDTLIGGADGDTYVIDSVNDIVIEGTDTFQQLVDLYPRDMVITSVSIDTLAAGIEDGRLTGDTALNLGGNELDNVLTGQQGANVLNGRGGNDTLDGLSGDDLLLGGDGNDTLNHRQGNGLDTLDGGQGSDTYRLTSLPEQIQNIRGNPELLGLASGPIALVQDSGTDGGIDHLITDFDTDLRREASGIENLTLSDDGAQSATVGAGNAQANVITGNRQDNTLLGFEGQDTLRGEAGRDYLDGGEGADVLEGGDGSDTYVVDDEGDVVMDNGGTAADVDQVISRAVTFRLTDTIEMASMDGDVARNLTGAANANSISGNAHDNQLSGEGGNDSLYGLAGNDLLEGGTGNDLLEGGTGADTLVGGAGADIYYVDDTADVVIETAVTPTFTSPDQAALYYLLQSDRVYSSAARYQLGENVEFGAIVGTGAGDLIGNEQANGLTGSNSNNQLEGEGGDDWIEGLAGEDTLSGGAGRDTLNGGDGNDRYVVTDTLDQMYDDGLRGGNDVLESHLEHLVLSDLATNIQNVELAAGHDGALRATGNEYNNRLTGNGFANILEGGDGDDVLDGGAGADTLIGGEGDDTYYIDDAGDVVIETGGTPSPWGNDRLVSSLSIQSLITGIESVSLTGTADLYATGNASDNRMFGNDGRNLLSGLAGVDLLIGGGGDDTLVGGIGDDALAGGLGADTFRFERGDGKDQVSVDRWDTIELGAGFSLSDMTLTPMYSDTLQIDFGNGDAITLLTDYQYTDNWDLGLTLKFADGSTISGAELVARVPSPPGAYLAAPSNEPGFEFVVEGTWGDDTLTGNGVDYVELYGGAGNDTYILTGSVTILDTLGSSDTLIVPSSQRLPAFGTLRPPVGIENLILEGAGSVTGNAADNRIEVGQGNSTPLRPFVLSGLEGNDTILGSNSHDRLNGGAGDDLLAGRDGDDVYLMSGDFGHDTVRDLAPQAGGTDELRFSTAGYNQLWFAQNGNDLVVSVVGSDNMVTVENWFLGAEHQVERITDTGQAHSLSAAQVANLVTTMSQFSPQDLGAAGAPAALVAARDAAWA